MRIKAPVNSQFHFKEHGTKNKSDIQSICKHGISEQSIKTFVLLVLELQMEKATSNEPNGQLEFQQVLSLEHFMNIKVIIVSLFHSKF